MYALCDANRFYCNNFEDYCRKQPQGPYHTANSAIDIVKWLVKPIEKAITNSTTDNWDTSISLANHLLIKGLTLIDTMKNNKAAIPHCFNPIKLNKMAQCMDSRMIKL